MVEDGLLNCRHQLGSDPSGVSNIYEVCAKIKVEEDSYQELKAEPVSMTGLALTDKHHVDGVPVVLDQRLNLILVLRRPLFVDSTGGPLHELYLDIFAGFSDVFKQLVLILEYFIFTSRKLMVLRGMLTHVIYGLRDIRLLGLGFRPRRVLRTLAR